MGIAWASIGVGLHIEACDERARKLRRDLARFDKDYPISESGRKFWSVLHEFEVDDWYMVRLLSEKEARLELVRQEKRAKALRPWSPLHRIASLCHANE